jgi:prepilin-type N-terminal cleavage/methylation domain-containing protein
MHRSRQSNPSLAVSVGRARRAFTLIELIFVLVLLTIGALFVTANMTSFFRGRVLNFEARRMLSLTHYAQSRAVSEGVPVILWINPTASTYGLSVQSSFSDPGEDTRAVSYKAESSLTFEVPTGVTPPISEQDDERLGITDEALSFIRFTPDGFFDDSSVSKIIIRAGSVPGLELVPMLNRLGYEIRPESLLN